MKGINKEEKNGIWKGHAVGYHALHSWIKRRLVKTKLCQNCKNVPPFDLANISQKYKRDLSDWEWLCRSCHMKKDLRLEKLSTHNHSGELNGRAKLNKQNVLEIKKERLEGMKVKDLAKKYKVAITTIEYIIYGKSWKN
jgi:hypothetical protein